VEKESVKKKKIQITWAYISAILSAKDTKRDLQIHIRWGHFIMTFAAVKLTLQL
jgi:hypothetical protein